MVCSKYYLVEFETLPNSGIVCMLDLSMSLTNKTSSKSYPQIFFLFVFIFFLKKKLEPRAKAGVVRQPSVKSFLGL